MVEIKTPCFFDEMKKQGALIEAIRSSRPHGLLDIGVEVKLVEEMTLERFDGKGQWGIGSRNI